MKLFTFIAVVMAAMYSAISVYGFNLPNYGTPLSAAVSGVIHSFFTQHTNTVLLIKSSSPENSQHQSDIINAVMYKTISKMSVMLEDSDDMSEMRLRRYNIIFVDSYGSFHSLYNKMTPYKFDYSGFYLIVLTDYSTNQYKIMKMILEDLWKLQITNSNIVVEARSANNDVHFYTFYPFSELYCEKVLPVIATTYRNKSFTQNVFYPNKVENLHNCTIAVATFNTPPFMILKMAADGSSKIVDGLEGKLITVLSKVMNFNVKIIVPENDERWGVLKIGETATGATGLVSSRFLDATNRANKLSQQVISGKANLTVGYFGTNWIRNFFMTNTFSYYSSSLCFVRPPGRTLTSFEKLVFPFSKVVWIFVLLIFVVAFFVIFLLKFRSAKIKQFTFGKRNYSPNLNLMNIFFGGAIINSPSMNFARTLFMIWVMYCFIVRTAYQGALFNILQNQENISSVNTIQDMLNQNYNFYMTNVGLNVYGNRPKTIEDRFENVLD